MEKAYKTMHSVGVFNLVAGILMIISGIATGCLVIVKGVKLLQDKAKLTF